MKNSKALGEECIILTLGSKYCKKQVRRPFLSTGTVRGLTIALQRLEAQNDTQNDTSSFRILVPSLKKKKIQPSGKQIC